jgi:hypothetical protein
LFKEDVIIDILTNERIIAYNLNVNQRLYQGKRKKYLNYSVLKPMLVHEITEEDFKNAGQEKEKQLKVFVTLKDPYTPEGVEVHNFVTLHDHFNETKIGVKDAQGDPMVYQFKLMDHSLKNEQFWQTPIQCQGDYLEMIPKKSSDYVITILPFSYGLSHYNRQFSTQYSLEDGKRTTEEKRAAAEEYFGPSLHGDVHNQLGKK